VSAQMLLEVLGNAGVKLARQGTQIRWQAPPSVDAEELVQTLRAHKEELLILLDRPSTPSALSAADYESIREHLAERAAIQEHDGGFSRVRAEELARSAMRVYRYRLTDNPAQWMIMIAPGCDLAAAKRAMEARFGSERVVEVVTWTGSLPDF
jgi:hypothetical protein